MSFVVARGYNFKKEQMELDTIWKDRGIRKRTQDEIGESALMASNYIRGGWTLMKNEG